MFLRTNQGLYRLDSQTSQKLSIDTTRTIRSLAVSDNNLYVATGPDLSVFATPGGDEAFTEQLMRYLNANESSWEIGVGNRCI